MNRSPTISISNKMPPGSLDVLIVLGAIVLVALIIFICVLSFRKEGKLKHKHHHRHHRKSYREQIKITANGVRELIRQRRRHRRREHRQINPTLAQTGGLPPPRAADKPPPSPPPP